MPLRPVAGTIRFGAFEVEPNSGTLRKDGTRVRLQEQPFQVLLALLERPGEVVTREELHQKVWNGESFADLDHRLNIAVNKIREALRDSPETPRFVETLPRRGYRFIAAVESPQVAEPAPPPPRPRVSRRWWLWVAAAVPVLAATVWILTPRNQQEPPLIPVPLTSYPGIENAPDFSPDGTQVAFQWDGPNRDNFDIYVKMIGSDPPLRLTDDPAPEWSPAWSPDGRQIAFLRKLDAEHRAIYVVPPVGGTERKIAELRRDEAGTSEAQDIGRQLSWSSDGKWLATFEQGPPGQLAGMVLIPVERGERRRLSPTDSPGLDFEPAFSPDGRSLAFMRCEEVFALCELHLLELDLNHIATAKARRLTREGQSMTGIAWTQDGKQLVYAGSDIGHAVEEAVLWRVPVSGSARAQRLVFAGASAQSPAISRQGRLAYSRWVTDYDIWQIDTGGLLKRVVASSFWESSPQYSPDGRRIAFASERTGHAEVWIANEDGSEPRQLTFGSLHSGSPRWSPDGRSIVFDSMGEDGRYDIYVVDAAGGQPRRMTKQEGNNAMPSWSRDGKWIYFSSNRSGRMEIMRMPAGGGEATRITANGGYTGFESPDGASIFFTKGETVRAPDVLWRTPVGGGKDHLILPSVFARAFAVVEDGIYYIPGPGPDGTTSLQFFEFASGKSRLLARIEGHLALGLTVSPDRKRFVIARSIQWGSDLMLVENFR